MFRRGDRRDKADATDDGRKDEVDAALDELEGGTLEDEELDEQSGDQPEDMTADLESQAADYLAGNDVWMYGPNAETVLEILDRLEEIVPDEARVIAEAWLLIPKSDREHARKAARKLAEVDEEIARYLQLIREAVGTWMAVTGPYPEFVSAEPDWGRLCAQTGEAALDAATAVILEGKLDEIHYESLFEPWSEAMAQLETATDEAKIEAEVEGDAGDEDEEAEAEEDAEDEGKFGPNSDDVTDFLTRLWLLTPEQVGRLVSGWQNSERDDLKTAHEALRALAEEDPEWRGQVRNAQEELTPWLNAGRIQETSGFLGQTGQNESRKMAGPALADAIAALVLGDLLDGRDAAMLYGPWFNLIGAPPLPVVSPKAAAATKKGPGGKAAAKGAKAATKGAKGAKGAAKTAASGGKTAGTKAATGAKAATSAKAKAGAKTAPSRKVTKK